MIADAFSAEIYKLMRNRMVLFWAFIAAPVATLLFGLVIEGAVRGGGADLGSAGRIEPIGDAWRAGGSTANLIVQLLLILGASVVFGGEYRWETWRTIVPRAGRFALMLAKMAAFALAAALSIAACALFGFLVGIFSAAINGAAPSWPSGPAAALGLGLSLIASLLQACVIGAVCALACVLTRSVLAATLIAFLIMLGQEIGAGRIPIQEASFVVAAIPTVGARGMREWGASLMGDPQTVGAHLGPPGAVMLVVWLAVLTLATLAVFQRQDLARE